jgi:nicotinate-nucleotide pyrophosphorylase (carboxylating)
VINAEIQRAVRNALDEDLGRGDITAALIPADQQGVARVISRERAVLCGKPWFTAVFHQLDAAIRITWRFDDGDRVEADDELCRLSGNARALLSGERTALNFLQTLSGTATLAQEYHDRVSDLPVTLLDTRKTLPGLRYAQKYAVRCGGCTNHRLGLYDGILIKENHIAACGGLVAAVSSAKRLAPSTPVEVEVESLAELEAALHSGADRLLLDNFELDTLRAAVARTRGQVPLEASGGVNLETVRGIAETGVDFISIGGLTKDVRAVDMSMRFLTE